MQISVEYQKYTCKRSQFKNFMKEQKRSNNQEQSNESLEADMP